MSFLCGVIEGFYGRPWPAAERRRTIEHCARVGLGTYVYAPKRERLLRRDWAQPFAPAELEALGALSAYCRQHGILFGVGLSPWGLQQGMDGEQRQALRNKLAQINSLAPGLLCILFDDMPGEGADLARAQLEVAGLILAHSTAQRHALCPSYYSFDPVLDELFGPRPPHYLGDLGVGLPGAVDLLWTGPLVISPGYTRADIDAASAALGRAPMLWDNCPVNDGRKTSRFLPLGPYRQRPWQLAQWCGGHLVNPMNQPALSRLALSTLGDLYRQGEAYDPEASWQAAVLDAGGDALWQLFQRDRLRFARDGLDAMAASERDTLAREYRALGSTEGAEVADWLCGDYAFDPECLND